VTQIVEKEVIKYVDRPVAPVTHTHTHDLGQHGVGGGASYGSGSSYGGGSSYGSGSSAGNLSGVQGGFADCPSGTTQQADGTCLEAAVGGWTGGYTAPTTVVTPSTSGGEYCYGDSGKRYDSLGKEIKGAHGTDCKH